MTGTDTVTRTTLRTSVFGNESDIDLTTRMKPHVPARGLASARLADSRTVPRSALRLIDSRILSTALRFLDQDPCPLLLSGLTRFQALTRAARDTLTTPGRVVVVPLIEPYRVTSRHRPEVAVIVDGKDFARIAFDLVITFSMCETAVAVQHGAIESIDCQAGTLAVSLSLADGERLLQRTVKFPVKQEVRPPMRIPLPEGRPLPTRATGRR